MDLVAGTAVDRGASLAIESHPRDLLPDSHVLVARAADLDGVRRLDLGQRFPNRVSGVTINVQCRGCSR
ncbi:hypothetical protein D3C83_253380 [compost metagenome]